jgi:hypothetical protein
MVNIIKSKRGWVRLIEVFIAILLLTGVLLVVINRSNSPEKNTLYNQMSNKELAILRDIELNDTMRAEILSILTLPLDWTSFNLNGLEDVKSRIIYLTPTNLKCEAKICAIDENCISELSGENVYARAVFISADLNTYSPRQLKLFCSEKGI